MKNIGTQKSQRSPSQDRSSSGREAEGHHVVSLRSSWALQSRPRLLTSSWTGIVMSSQDR